MEVTMARKRQTTAETLLGIANVLTLTAQLGADVLGGLTWTARRKAIARREYMHEEGLALKNQLAAERIRHEVLKQQVTSNREIKTGLDIDRKVLEIRREEFRQVTSGILPEEQAQIYRPRQFADVE